MGPRRGSGSRRIREGGPALVSLRARRSPGRCAKLGQDSFRRIACTSGRRATGRRLARPMAIRGRRAPGDDAEVHARLLRRRWKGCPVRRSDRRARRVRRPSDVRVPAPRLLQPGGQRTARMPRRQLHTARRSPDRRFESAGQDRSCNPEVRQVRSPDRHPPALVVRSRRHPTPPSRVGPRDGRPRTRRTARDGRHRGRTAPHGSVARAAAPDARAGTSRSGICSWRLDSRQESGRTRPIAGSRSTRPGMPSSPTASPTRSTNFRYRDRPHA